jgi:hypothetical protein
MKPYKKPPTPEALLTRAVRQLLNAAGIFHFKHWGGPLGEPGISDIIGCYKGRMIAIELKAPKGVLSLAQEEFIRRINDAGGLAFCARSIDEVIYGLNLQDRFLIK